jgi:Basic region leucine zipper
MIMPTSTTSSRSYCTSIVSRERNKIHARKTRQRKKEQMQTLQSRADELKADQLRLKQIINEKNTASILVGLFACSATTTITTTVSNEDAASTSASSLSATTVDEDPRVEELLKRPAEEIPDASKISDLPSLILPGHYSMRRGGGGKAVSLLLPEDLSVLDDMQQQQSPQLPQEQQQQQQPDDGIDYDLLSKDRSKCSAEELDRIRRERNKLHAKRTRDRKRRFMEEMGEVCRQLQEENNLLRHHLRTMDPDFVDDIAAVTASESREADAASSTQRSRLSPKLPMSLLSSINLPPHYTTTTADTVSSDPRMAPFRKNITALPLPPRKFESINHHQIQALLAAAVSFEQCHQLSSSSSSTMTCSTQRPVVLSSSALTPSTAAATTMKVSDSDSSCASMVDSDDGSSRPVPFPKRPRLEHKRPSMSTIARC